MNADRPDAARFGAVYDDCATRVYAYARRHSDASAAEDIVAETFLVAWRRLSDVPDDPLPWLLVVARNVIANHRRATQRHDRLYGSGEAAERLMAAHPATDDIVVDRDALLHALADLSEAEREAVLLIAWDGLSTRDAAAVAGCTSQAFSVRLHRARRRLARSLDTAPTSSRGTAARTTPALVKETP